MPALRASIVILAVLAPALVGAAPRSPLVGGPRLRPDDSRSASLLLEGLQRSDTLRALVEELETHDVIVYLQRQPRLSGRLAGTLTWITATARFRYVRVSWSPDMSTEAAISTLGHELQHALEVANEPSITSAESLEAYYRTHGINMRSHNGWDTLAARDRGDEVRKDLAVGRSVRVIESMQDFDPLEWHVVYRRAREQVR